jgi:hypothetical protein
MVEMQWFRRIPWKQLEMDAKERKLVKREKQTFLAPFSKTFGFNFILSFLSVSNPNYLAFQKINKNLSKGPKSYQMILKGTQFFKIKSIHTGTCLWLFTNGAI